MAGSIEDFEQPIQDLEAQIERVKRLTREQGIDRSPEIAELDVNPLVITPGGLVAIDARVVAAAPR